MQIPDIEPNSHKYKREQKQQVAQKERAKKVVSGATRVQKQGELSKIASKFISDDAHNVKNYVRDDIVIPAIKDTILDIIVKGATMIFGGGRHNVQKNNPLSNISYYTNYADRFAPQRTTSQPRAARSALDYSNIVFANRPDAELVIDQMWGTISRYGYVTVMDLYDMADMTAPYTSDKYGWTDISSASVERVMGGYIIKLPRAMPID